MQISRSTSKILPYTIKRNVSKIKFWFRKVWFEVLVTQIFNFQNFFALAIKKCPLEKPRDQFFKPLTKHAVILRYAFIFQPD